MSGFADHFSSQAADYARHRPRYPAALFDWLAELAPATGIAWEVGCGSGQATAGLAARFERVLACDPSPAQLERAPALANVEYAAMRAEDGGLAPASADLVLAAQAAHWFDMAAFAGQADRVLRPGGVLALVGYGLPRVAPEIDAVIDAVYRGEVGPYWPPERRHIDTRYAELPFPYPEIAAPDLALEAEWRRDDLLGYVGSWSAVARYRRETGRDPLPGIADRFAEVWPDAGETRPVAWPLFARVGRKPGGTGG